MTEPVMFELSVQGRFSAAHHLPGYDGKCAGLHGHNWGVELFVRGSQTAESGMLTDFKELRAELTSVLDELDHADLNRVERLVGVNPTSENIARFLYRSLSERLNCDTYTVARVTVRETPESAASYWEDGET